MFYNVPHVCQQVLRSICLYVYVNLTHSTIKDDIEIINKHVNLQNNMFAYL